MGGDGYEGYEPEYEFAGYDPEPEFEPSADDFARMRFLDLFPYDERHFTPEGCGHFTDPEMDEFASGFDPDHGEEFELFRAALFLRGWRLTRRVPWPVLRLLLAVLIRESWRQDVTFPVGADRRPAADLSPPVALLRARTILTAAPPARVPCPAGTTG